MKYFKFFIVGCILTFTTSCGQQKRYIEYKVKEGETMRGIAKKLDMKTKDLLRLNPNIDRKPEVNTVIVIPNKKMNTNKTEDLEKSVGLSENKIDSIVVDKEEELRELKNKFVVYEVKKGDTFYSLTRFYNVTQEEMLVLNPELSEGLKTGQIIKMKVLEEGEDSEVSLYEDVIEERISLKAALLLPFRTNENDSIGAKELFGKSKLANIVADFYLGVEIAVDSLRGQGVDIDLAVFDTERKSTKIKTILEEESLNEKDVIIGPLYSEEAKVVAKEVDVPVVFPVYSKNQVNFSSPKLIKTSPEKSVFREELINYIKDNFTKGSLILVGDGEKKSNESNLIIKKSLEVHDSISEVHILKPQKGYIAKKRFLDILKPNEDNWVVLTSKDNVLVADVVNSLISLPDATNATVFTYNKGKSFDNVANFKLAKVNLTYVSDEYVDGESVSTKIFNQQYLTKNNALPSYYAVKGFDIAYDILMRLASGNALKSTFEEGASYRVESKFDYFNKSSRAFENKGLFIVQYKEDLSLIRLK